MNENDKNISNKKLAFDSAIITTAMVFLYSIIIMIYVLIRTSVTICNIMPAGERISIVLQNGLSVGYSISIFSIIFAIITSIIGIFTAISLKKLMLYFNPKFKNKTAIFISGILGILIISVVYFSLRVLLKDLMTINYIESFSFWFLFPAILFLVGCLIGGYKMNIILNK